MVTFPALFFTPTNKKISASNHAITRIRADSISLFKGAIIIDQNGYKRTVLEVQRKGWAYILGYHPFLKGRSIQVEFTLSEGKPITLSELKEFLSGKIQEKWKSELPQPINYKQLINKIENAESYKEIVNIYLYDLL